MLDQSGPWRDDAAPDVGPPWTQLGRFAGLIVVDIDSAPRLVARAYLATNLEGQPAGVTVELPVGEAATLNLLEQTGVELREITLVSDDVDRSSAESLTQRAPPRPPPTPTDDSLAPRALTDGLTWFSFLGYTNWVTGEPGLLYQEIRVAPAALYQRMFGAQSRIGQFSLGYTFLFALAIVGVLFLVIEFTALIMGLALARSITGSVQQLFVSTEHVRGGDFEHRIIVQTRDQLGELAESFNAMTGSARGFLQQAAEKKRLEEELRIARRATSRLLKNTRIGLFSWPSCVSRPPRQRCARGHAVPTRGPATPAAGDQGHLASRFRNRTKL